MDWTDLTAYIGAAKSSLDMIKSAAALLPKGQNKDEIERNLRTAEDILKRSDAKLAKELGFSLCECEYPPRPMLWRDKEKAFVCQNPACGHRIQTGVHRDDDDVGGYSF
jgi:hypothetical protein